MPIIEKYSLLELFLAHEIQLHEAVKKEQWEIAAKILYAMSEALPKPEGNN